MKLSNTRKASFSFTGEIGVTMKIGLYFVKSVLKGVKWKGGMDVDEERDKHYF